MWEVADSMEKVQRYNAIIAYLTVLPIVTALPMLILWQGVLWHTGRFRLSKEGIGALLLSRFMLLPKG